MRMQSYLGVAISTLLVGGAFAACKASDTSSAAPPVKCTPGAYVFCRCEDRSQGTKLCRPDGISFDDCKCDGTGGPVIEDPDSGMIISTPPEEVDAGPVTGPIIDAKCTGKMGLVAGSKAPDHDVFFASYKGGGMFSVTKSFGLGVRGPITVLPVGASLVATYVGDYQYMGFTKLAGGSWSTPTSLGDGNATSGAATSAVLLNGQIRAFYLNGADGKYHMQSYTDATGWQPDALGPGAVAEQSGDSGAPVPGKSAPAAAAVGSTITLAFTGDDGTLAREQYSGSSWSLTKFGGSASYPAQPAIVALDPGGTRDELLVYAGSDLLIHVAARVSSNKAWNTAILFDTAASSTDLALQAMPGGKAMLVYKSSSDGQGYYSVWTEATGFAAPTPLVAGTNPELASAPSIVRGQCGSDVTIAYATKDGLVKILRYTAGAMSDPFDVGGITKASWVGVGELP
ncbi:MAG: hypothetical protein QOI41_6503 [Myxococcales bacterium]|nr:hypothetical protein [Myxococcales bacterium]